MVLEGQSQIMLKSQVCIEICNGHSKVCGFNKILTIHMRVCLYWRELYRAN